ncbi:DNA adenine methylase [Microbacterium sp. cx-59]|uniref:DNA adenine methylase n=1 Tax=Microbacterium sp. cx-59 TaxID=2891207 RepID=UPI001E593BD4|nr:DNA adenine methylase [Microbacterium sp. cx-59]MCC4908464.1 DNA adenine methylase [Microbacterium sp. cx-59]
MRLAGVTVHRGQIHTPLRYPGGKSRLAGFLRSLIEVGGWTDREYAEPYGGGAGAALTLLMDKVVPRIAINDLDPAVHEFWRAVVDQSDRFSDKVRSVPLTLDEWRTQKAIYRDPEANGFDRGFAMFYLNRTNRSGVLHAGVIGGQKQGGKYLIDARFNREDLAARVEAIGARSDDISVTSMDGAEFIRSKLGEGAFVYADPPYYEKGALLYLNAFDDAAHSALAKLLTDNPDAIWLLTYDDCAAIRKLYRGRYQGTFELPYSAHRAERAQELMVMSSPIRRAMDLLPAPTP